MKKLFIIIFLLFIFGCATTAPVPAWKDKAYRYLDDYKNSFLTGKEKSSEPHFVKARRELAAGNDIKLLMTAYLTKYALHTASLEKFDTSEFAKLYRLEPSVADMAYCHFLKGNFSAVDASLLPKRYIAVLKAVLTDDAKMAIQEITLIPDPLSRLVACGVWIKYRPSDEQILQIGISTASANGWRRPLGAYLDKLHSFYLENGKTGKAKIIEERMGLLKE